MMMIHDDDDEDDDVIDNHGCDSHDCVGDGDDDGVVYDGHPTGDEVHGDNGLGVMTLSVHQAMLSCTQSG